MDISPELIRDISVKAVEDFLNNKIPLSKGLAKQAAAYDLNSEQVKRAVESTNNIAYLKILQMSDDRTVEFPLAKFAEVMTEATIPEDLQEKSAAVFTKQSAVLEKTASELIPVEYEMAENEKLVYFIKSARANKQALEALEIESMNIAQELVKVAKEIGKDRAWMDKLACVTDKATFSQLSILVSGDLQNYRNLKELGLFKEAQLKEVGKFAGLFKQAQALVREQRKRMELQKRADDAAQTIRNGFSNGVNNAMNSMKNTAQKVMQAPGHVMGKAVGTVASMPFRAATSAGSAVKDSLKSNFEKAVGSGSGKATSAVKAVGATSGSALRGVFNAANPVLDAALYDPGVESTTGRSNDVWNALQRE
jgi:hypothetical protein